ncbi:hypothetical protein [Kibdelosporangium phytohabitans]|uniref:hypothetical protein n=1 Tax=Kibdelosporangium phytohabitans TaxID=860235 RepID=UPI0012F924DE|nr:hypothetical protein [Kibdelosporangium phytohabitans]MBE1466470.1 hypothetical protein [Kibdelosporangium phytohabitans]
MSRGLARFRRAMVWVPAPAGNVRQALHAAGLGAAVLVPADAGTVVVLGHVTEIRDTHRWAQVTQKVADVAVVFAFGYRGNSYPIRVAGVLATSLSARLAEAFGVSEDTVVPYLRTDADNAVRLLEAVGKPETAQVARRIGEGALDERMPELPGAGPVVLYFIAAIVWMALAVALNISMIIMGLGVLAAFGAMVWHRRRVTRSRPVDEVLPVVPFGQLGVHRKAG